MLAAELGNADAIAIKVLAGLLGCQDGGHSVHSCSFVFVCCQLCPNIWACKGECLKSCASGEFQGVSAGERLREERMLLGLKQDEFAQLGGVNRNTQGSYEKGERNPDTAYLSAVAAAGVDVLYVLTGVRATRAVEGLSSSEERLVSLYRQLTEDDQKAVHRIVGAMAEVPAGLSQK
ncbi:helix-turn-helix transcriptional regulator [Pseudomonas weihenstephanensis]|jgi:transcriptional regulator with XRE-family HTH domain|uniref:helix-turn-helix domain-containing protein n=1 Tax=Pseudomonas TaxID=286 RepID=UPI001473E95E|nr:helix-turn-helix transcriptional regulator [Pseudomonas weihenstephanensis]NMY38137.1 helix-turn-helix transcriptional regulator [Pseudomonas sp. WS 5078]NMY61053.1 helix-turn-helix transcriptional regulator [Pseudomonas sp. WS 5354]